VVLAGMVYRLFRERSPTASGTVSTARVYSEALLVSVSNPFQVLWWATVGWAFAYVGGAVLFLGLFGAIVVWAVVFPMVLAEGARRDPRVPRAVSRASGARLAGFAGYFTWSVVGLPL
jgi:threonine/homoserine/homoserine lactone efflux protein